MYKRAVRVLFAGPGVLTAYAQRWLKQLGGNLAEAQCTPVLDPAVLALAWADVLIIIGEAPYVSTRSNLAVRRWRPPADGDLDEWARAQVAGVLGGIRLLARLDAQDSSD